MNVSLFSSWVAAAAAILIGAFLGWLWSLGARPGSGPGSDGTYLLASGWTALGLMVLVTLYSLRKYLHKLGISPETRNPPPAANLEKAESRLNELRSQILKGVVTEKGDAEKIGRRILKEEGVTRIARVEVRDGPRGVPRFLVEVLPTEPLGRVAKWLHLHVYLGLAAGVLVWLHGGGQSDSFLGAAMNGLTAVVIVTGVVGTFLFALGPSWLTAREKDLSFEEAFVLDRSLQGKIVWARKNTDLSAPAAAQDLAVLEGQRQRIQENLTALSRIRFWMNIWRAVHIPASILLLALALVHVVSVWMY